MLLHANPVLDAEHLAVFGARDATTGIVTKGLVPDDALTYKSTVTGNWSAPGTWAHRQSDGTFKADGSTPGLGDNVLIAGGTTVTVDNVFTTKTDGQGIAHRSALHTIRDDGTLQFATNVNTALLVDTVIVESSGTFLMGTANQRIAADASAKVIFAQGPIDQTWDPLQFSKGLVSHGTVSIYGTTVTSFVQTTAGIAAPNPPAKNSSPSVGSLDLGAIPIGWKSGDRIIITGDTATDSNNHNQDEELQLSSIVGSVATFTTPFKYRHSSGSVYVSDVTRNATFESEDVVDVAQRGHIMFMHSDHVTVDAAGFYGLGRTDKRNPIDDPVLVADVDHPGQMTTDVLSKNVNAEHPELGHRVLVPVVDSQGRPVLNSDGTPKLQIARTGLNARGRYAVHFHRTGTDPAAGISVINDSAVVDSPGWGIVNHSSNVDVSNNVVFNAVGAAYVTEAGDEIGDFRHNIAIHSQGSGAGIESRKQVQDFGHQGDGFWLQGGNVSLTDNVAAGQRHSGFVFFPVGLDQKGLGVTTISGTNLTQYAWADPKANYAVGDVPLKEFRGNVAFASGDAFESWFSQLNVPAARNSQSTIENFTAWNLQSGTAIFTPYTNLETFKNVTVTGSLAHPGGTAFARNDVTRNMTYDHVHIAGFNVGIDAPVNGTTRIQGGSFNNLKSIFIATANSTDRVVNINDTAGDPMQFTDNLTNSKGQALQQFNVFLQTNFNPKENDITRLFNPDVIRLGTVLHNGVQVYYLEQAANFVPFNTSSAEGVAAYVPQELRDKTNQQLWDQYGLAIGGIVAPASAVSSDPRINGLLGPMATYLPRLWLESAKYFNEDKQSYYLNYRVSDPGLLITGKHNSEGYVTVRENTATVLHPGWNVVTRDILGHVRAFLVYGDITPPSFELSSGVPQVINQADIDRGSTFVVQGFIVDDSFGKRHFELGISLNDSKHVSPVHTKVDPATGKTINVVTLTFEISDFAGNKTTVNIDIAVTSTATLIKDIGRKDLPTITPSITLLALLDKH